MNSRELPGLYDGVHSTSATPISKAPHQRSNNAQLHDYTFVTHQYSYFIVHKQHRETYKQS